MIFFPRNFPGTTEVLPLLKKGFVLLYTIFFFLALSCNDSDTNKTGNQNGILNTPPFKVLSDKIHNSPNNPAFYLERGELLSQRQMHKLASADFTKAWQLNPDEKTGLLASANLFLAGSDQQAIDFLLVCSRKFPSNLEFPRRLGEAYLQLGRTREALSQFDILLQQDSGNFEAWYEKGALLAQSHDTVNAIRSLEAAYSLQPLQHYGITLANLYAESRNRKALPLCDELIAKDTAGELTDAFFVKGIYYANTGQKEKALEEYENCINRDWKFIEAYIEKGIILYKDRNIDEALKTFALAAKVSNTDPDAYYWMARCFESIGKKEEAKENYRRALALDRSFIEAARGLERIK
jgi:tetratricopeptide (TPR) repeat protein